MKIKPQRRTIIEEIIIKNSTVKIWSLYRAVKQHCYSITAVLLDYSCFAWC